LSDDLITKEAFQEAAENLAQQVAIRNATLAKTKQVEIRV
jgi:ATP-binding protein involved in chromosome partitioning